MLTYMLKKILLWNSITQLLVLLLAMIFYKRADLLAYINVSFIIGTALILIAMAGYVIKGRFFDIIFYSFQHTFSNVTEKDRRPLSRLVPQNYQLPLITGIVTIMFMLLALSLY